MPAPTSYVVRARTRPDGTSTMTAAASSLDLDATWGEDPTGAPGPADLLAGAFAACLLKNLARCRDLLAFDYDEATVEVTARRQDAPPRFVEIAYRVELGTPESARRVELVHQNLRRFGTVYNTLAAVCDVHGTVAIAPRSSSADGQSELVQ